MKIPAIIASAALACAALSLPYSANASHGVRGQSVPASLVDAEIVRELNLMLMATSLRCQQSRFDFRAQYEAFNHYNLNLLNSAYARMREDLIARYGEYRAQIELERKDADMANRYGGGHPWMNCAQLRDEALWLAEPLRQETLVEVAWALIGDPYQR